mmetsp:Transcript_14580/g.22631  ORF Transcript_14580/g.22631 Transcript_14580/m.22631 type:complete len:145 (-) Transcript_14580:411-845(-)
MHFTRTYFSRPSKQATMTISGGTKLRSSSYPINFCTVVLTQRIHRFDPFAIDDDIIAACEHVAESEADHVAKGYCSDVASRCTEPGGACIEIFYFPNKESAQLLAPAINEIYGITSSGVSGPRPLSWGWIFVAVTGLGVLLSRQ